MKYGEGGIKKSTSKHSGKSYWLTTSQKNMQLLNELRGIVPKNNKKQNRKVTK